MTITLKGCSAQNCGVGLRASTNVDLHIEQFSAIACNEGMVLDAVPSATPTRKISRFVGLVRTGASLIAKVVAEKTVELAFVGALGLLGYSVFG